MPESTTITPSEVVTSTTPQSHLSGSEIAQPYEGMARAFDKIGGGLEDLAVPLAERAGAQSVTKDDQGNIQVEHVPIFGKAGEAYARMQRVAYFTQVEGNAERQDIALRQQHRDDPEAYQTAADAYRDKTVADAATQIGPEAANQLGRAIDSKTTMTYRGLLNEKERLDLERADNSIKAGLESARDDATALARQGIDQSAPEMQQALNKYDTLLNERMNNPRLAYTKDQANLDRQQFQSELGANRYLYHIDQTYKDKGFASAENDAKDILTNQGYKLTEAQREAYYHRAIGEVRANEAIRRQDIGQAQQAFRELSVASQLGQRIEPEEVDSVRKAFKAANYPAGVAMVDAAFAHKDLHDEFGRQPLADQTKGLNAIRGAQAAKTAYDFFRGRGYRDEEAAGIVGNLAHESGLNPAIMGDRGTSGGLAQFHAERLTALKEYAASQNKPWTDFQTQLEFIDRELSGKEGFTRGLLRTATTPEEAAAAFVNYERPAGYTPGNPAASLGFQSRQALARSVYGGKAVDGSGGPGVSSWLIANRTAAVDDTATRQWTQIMKDWSSGGAVPSRQAVSDVLDAARATKNVDLLARVAQDTQLMDYVERSSQLPVPQQAALETELRRREAGGQSDPGAQLVLKQLEAKTQAITKGLEENPIATAVANFPDKFKTPPPLDFSSPQNLAAGLKMRGQIAQVAAANWQTGPVSALDKADLQQVKGILSGPDPAVKAQVYGAIAMLPEDVRAATLKKLGGNEPAGMAEAAAGSLMATAPEIAASIFRGQGAIKADKRYDPESENGSKAAFQTDLDRAMPASLFTLQGRTDPAGPYATMTAMVKARYADLAAQAGQTAYSKDRLNQAVTDVTGGVLEHNGGSFIAPARGMSQRQFDGVLQGVTDRDLAGVTTLNGQPIEARYLRDNAQLESVGDGRYWVRLGRDPMAPVYAYSGASGEMPTKFVLDLRNRAPAPLHAEVPPPSLFANF